MSRVEQQLRDLMESAVGEPPHRVTVAAVRRRVIRRRVLECASGVAAMALLAGAGVAVASVVSGPGRAAAAGSGVAGPPRYYVQMMGRPSQLGQDLVVRATATGNVTDQVGTPWAGAHVVAVAEAGTRDQAFYSVWSQGSAGKVTGSRIYQFQLTPSGQASGYTLVRGGDLGAQAIGSQPAGALAVSPGASLVAVTVMPGDSTASAYAIEVIDTATGQHAIWRDNPSAQGTVLSYIRNLVLAKGGRELGFEATPCPAENPACQTRPGPGVRVLNVTATGGELSGSQQVFSLNQLTGQAAVGIANDAVLTPDGSAVRVVVSGAGRGTTTMVLQFPVGGGQQSVLYRKANAPGDAWFASFTADPTGRYILLNAAPQNGWINGGKLVRLAPAKNFSIADEVW